MDIATVVGIFAGIGLILAAMATSGGVGIFISVPSLMITVGGTLAATLISFPLPQVISVFKVARNAFQTKDVSPTELISAMVKMAEKARREGILALEQEAKNVEDEFLKRGLFLAVDGIPPELIRNIMETEMELLEERHELGQRVFKTMGALAPAFGMIGTLIGLIQMLRKLDEPDQLGIGMATALITTFYGAIMANLIFLPMAAKLRTRTENELLARRIAIEGIISIQAGDNPRIVEEKLKAFLAPKVRETVRARS